VFKTSSFDSLFSSKNETKKKREREREKEAVARVRSTRRFRVNSQIRDRADRENEVQRRKREKKGRRNDEERGDTCLDVRCLARLSLEASCIPPRLSYPSCAELILLLLMSPLTRLERYGYASLRSMTSEMKKKRRKREKRKQKRARELTILRACRRASFRSRRANSQRRAEQTVVAESRNLLSSPRLEILVFNDRPMG